MFSYITCATRAQPSTPNRKTCWRWPVVIISASKYSEFYCGSSYQQAIEKMRTHCTFIPNAGVKLVMGGMLRQGIHLAGIP